MPVTWRWHGPGVLAADTITKLPPEAEGAVIVSGSHGGRYPGWLAAKAGARAVILNDAGIGFQEAGIGSLPWLEGFGIAAATIAHDSAPIGDTAGMFTHGVISRANAPARAAGVEAGQPAAAAAERLRAAPQRRAWVPELGEERREHPVAGGTRRILLLDSASLVRPEDAGQIIVTGSHGGLIGGDPALALRVPGFAGVFNDAGGGPGTTRLPALDGRGIAAFTVAAASARIGEAGSTFADGIISAVNETARRIGAREGLRAEPVLLAWARGRAGS
ncbi:hypothetical protein LPC08_07385 [Roseomonas sp. OT10]|uniref:hypothetical protein n=1 Tax=Roseomonas cutis TaxID=2897332 RepID=UPI001E5349A7|nr:hypothetical protein [Roseomonas sp. OT10]UFN50431.1 hypothetical protein LPC08_07385 [Roseomonas sp. OT10]